MAKPDAKAVKPARKRPMPPMALWEDPQTLAFIPAPEVLEWLTAEILDDTGSIHNPDHSHLKDAQLRVIWASGPSKSKGRAVVGMAEKVAFMCNAWQKGRQERQMVDWFGFVPDYLITLDGDYCSKCTDAAFCALVEHELYHIAHMTDAFGAPAFTQEGYPKLGIRGHDVEEFVGVVRRYGVGDPDSALARLAAAARDTPEVDRVHIAGACGTCLLKAA